MKDKIEEYAALDYVFFQVSWSDNSYEAYICSNSIVEKLARGSLDQLAMHLPKARASHTITLDANFKLQVDATIEASSWFTKLTVARFLLVVNVPNVLKHTNAIEDEIIQLEETRRFHITLYAKNHTNRSDDGVSDISYLKETGLTRIKVETASSDATKNELLRAMDLRLTALKEELAASFNHATGITWHRNQMTDLALFAQHFGALELSNFLSKLLDLSPTALHFGSAMKTQPSLNDSVSPDKIAEAERHNSSESDESLDSIDHSSNPGIPYIERSRSGIRSATPRRSASPMRRIQIGRSGSRRSTAITIKSLSYFPARDKATLNGDADVKVCEEDELELQSKKPENNVHRMSVQDAISLFERKQKDEISDVQKRKTSDASLCASKSVLRRWSAGASSSFNCLTHEKASDSCHQTPRNFDRDAEAKKEETANSQYSNPENLEVVTNIESTVASKVMNTKESTSTTEWNRRQEAELNEMLMKMRESSKPSKYRGVKIGNDMLSNTSTDQRGGFCSQYKEKRDEKPRSESARNHAEKQGQVNLLYETFDQSKAAMASKPTLAVVKRESAYNSQKPRRNSSPPILLKKEASKPTIAKSVSPNIGVSLPIVSLKKNSGTPPKTSPAVSSMVSSNNNPIRRRPQVSTNLAQPSARSEKPLERVKVTKGGYSVQPDAKQKTVAKNTKIVKPRSQLSGQDCDALSKTTFSNKHTRKSTVVPVESKPFLRKGAGVSPGSGLSVSKAKDYRVQKQDDSYKDSENVTELSENESTNATPALPTAKVIEDDLVEHAVVVDETLAAQLDNVLYIGTTDILDGNLTGTENGMENLVEPLITEIHHNDDQSISSAAWVDMEHKEYSTSCNNGVQGVSPRILPAASSSTRVRHSLSQMLQAESGEPEITEWGNAENPPSLVYQKDSPKGLKRLLKLTRKSKNEGNSTGLSSPSVFSEGEEEQGDAKDIDTLRKASFQTKGYGQPRSMVGENFDSGNSSKMPFNYSMVHDTFSGSDKLNSGHISTGLVASKASRSFFSLPSFRSSKASETKHR